MNGEECIPMDVPDTLVLEKHALAAMHAMIGVADDAYHGIPFFNGYITGTPAWMSHANWDYGSSHGRLIDALALARQMTASHEGLDVERQYQQNLLSFFGEDGLSYRERGFFDNNPYFQQGFDAAFEPGANMIDQRAVLLGLTTWLMVSGDATVQGIADRHVAALRRIAVKEADSWYYPASEYTVHGWPSFDALVTRLCPDPASMWGRQVMPLIRYHALTGNRDALLLSENFVQNIMDRSGVFHEDGSFNGALGYRNGHFHTRMSTLYSMARYAAYTQNAQVLAYVKRSFDWATAQGTRFGWMPGDLGEQMFEHETCTLVDAIGIAMALAQHGYAEYWAMAERFIRNHLCHAQLLDTAWIQQLDTKERDIHRSKTFYKVADRLYGAFAGYCAPNDFINPGIYGRGHQMDLQTCCIAAGTRGLYTAWINAVTIPAAGRVQINLLVNHATPEVHVASYLPYEGKLEIAMRQGAQELLVRIPEWVSRTMLTLCRERGTHKEVRHGVQDVSYRQRCFLRIENVAPGERLTLLFPVKRHATQETAAGLSYTASWWGDDVNTVSPDGETLPLYTDKARPGRGSLPNAPLRETSGCLLL